MGVDSDRASAREPLVTVLVTCCGQLEYTRLSVPRLFKHSRQPFELVFLDSQSFDGTAEYLAGVAAAASVRVEIVQEKAETGLGDAYKEAFARARGDFIVLLSNDTLVPEGWLGHLVALAKQLSTIGMVGPMSNYCPPGQWAGPVPYRIGARKDDELLGEDERPEDLLDMRGFDQFAQEWSGQHRTQWSEVDHLGAFCLLIKREVLEAIELFEATPEFRFADLEGFSTRARQAGFVLACCRDLYVHHFGTRSVAGPKLPSEMPREASPKMSGYA